MPANLSATCYGNKNIAKTAAVNAIDPTTPAPPMTRLAARSSSLRNSCTVVGKGIR
jgi:hypothetical protein